MSEHTPGPWTQGKSVRNRYLVYTSGASEPDIGTGMPHTWIDCNTPDNARLVAAAPDLLKAITRLLMSGDVRDACDAGALKEARAAIAKATGDQS